MREKGQSLVELALSFLVLVFLLGGAVEFGLVFFQYVQLRDAAQEGALYGSMCQDQALVEQRARGASSSPLDLQSADVQVLYEIVENGRAVKVSMVYDHEVFMPFVDKFIGDYVTLDAYVIDTILQSCI